jgi:ubiquitin carboxyl-terminal hydrolase 4/11/15
MFSLGHFSANKEMIPSGWNCVDDDKTYSPLEDRVQKGKQSPCNDSEEFEVESQRATSESSNEDDPIRSDAQSNQTRMNEESSEEDELVRPPPTRVSLTRLFGPSLTVCPLLFVVPFLCAF